MTAEVHPGGIYTGHGWPLCGSLPFWGPDPAEARPGRPYFAHLWPRDGQWDGAPARVWLVPFGVVVSPTLEAALGELVLALERGRCVALYGADGEQLAALGNVVRAWTCAGRA